ncbi:18616_t:CDS:2, partial [Dentiscutata erythropus]
DLQVETRDVSKSSLEYTKDVPAHYQNSSILFDHYLPNVWAEKKKEQLNNRLSLVSYIVAFIVLHRQGYRIVEYSGWTYILKWLLNPEYYHIDKHGK